MAFKNLLTIGGIALAASWYFGKDKIKNLAQSVQGIDFNLKSLHNLNFDGNGGATLKADVEIVNPSPIDLSIPGNLINIKQIDFFTKSGKRLGTAYTNLNNITIPANGTKTLQNIPVQIAISQAFSNINEILDIAGNTGNLKIVPTVQAFGKEFTIG
ncbi:hypothetical protein [Zunongwangia sp.]|uniref:hypothetical protein n=1 Tax=Zunongwangia sp. TaxID=1965325 RepID=UPI003AA7FB41